MAFFVHLFILLLHIKLPKEIESNDGINVYNNRQQHDSQDELLAIVCNRLQDCAQRLESNGNIQQMCGKKEIVEIAKDGKSEIPQRIQERIIRDCNTCFPNLVTPVNTDYPRKENRDVNL